MLRARRATRFLVAVSAAITLASCSALTMPTPALPVTPSKLVALRTKNLKHAASIVYVGSVGGFIDTFTLVKGQYQKTAQISDYNGPEGIHTDADASMYVADQGLSSYGEPQGDIAIYPKGASYPKREIFPGYNVSDVVPVGINGYLYSTNFGPVETGFGPGSLSYYLPTGNEPKWTKVIAGSFQAWGLVRDPSSKDVFVSYSIGYFSTGGGEVGRSAHGKREVKPIAAIATAGGMAEDGSGNLLAASGGSIAIMSHSGKSLGSISVPGSAYRMAFNRDYSLLYVTNFGNYDVEIFTYPAGKLVGTITSSDWSKYDWTDGIAVWPPPKQ
jgi:hypothetical protein